MAQQPFAQQPFLPHPIWTMLADPDSMTQQLKDFVNWCFFNDLPLPRMFRQRAMDEHGISLNDIPYSKYDARDGKAGRGNMYARFFQIGEDDDY